MLMLALESSAKTASAALFEDGTFLGQYFQSDGLTHSCTLLPMAQSLVKNTGRTLRQLGCVAVAHGPGSFTGLRISMAAAKGLTWALEIPAIGVSTLEAMAAGGPDAEGAMLCCVMDARRSQVYNALFEIRGGVPCRLTPDRAVSIAALEAEMKTYLKKSWILLGDGAQLCYNALDKDALALRLAPVGLRMQCARGVGLAALGKEPAPADELLPVYLRLSQAERERQERMQRQTTEN